MRKPLSPQTIRFGVLLIVLGLMVLFFNMVIPNYLNGRLFNRITSSVSIMAIVATAQTLVIITRNIDLSIGAIVGFVAFATGSIVSSHPNLHPLLLVCYAMLLGAGFGAVNGVLVAFARVPSIIVTLATMAIFRSILVEYSDAKSITTENLPSWLVDFPNQIIFSIGALEFRAGFMMALFVVLLVQLALSRLRWARKLYAVGSNPDAATITGINSERTIFATFVIAGALAGLAGFMFLARFGTITVVAGLGTELKSVAAAVVGGVNIFGGSGSVFGALIGAIMVDLIESSLTRWELVSEFWREAVLGFLILMSVTFDRFLLARMTRKRDDNEGVK